MSNTTGSRSSSITLPYVGIDSLESVFSKSPVSSQCGAASPLGPCSPRAYGSCATYRRRTHILPRSYPASPVPRTSPPPCPARPVARGMPVGACTPPPGLPVLPSISLSRTHAAATTPAEATGARVARFPVTGSLPRTQGGSASASPVARPAQRSLRVAACVLADRPTAAFGIEVLQSMSLPP